MLKFFLHSFNKDRLLLFFFKKPVLVQGVCFFKIIFLYEIVISNRYSPVVSEISNSLK